MASFFADVLVAVHLAIVIFVVGLPILVLIGWPLKWRWTRTPWLRWGHLAIMAYIVMNAIRGELCFLTHWESSLREQAGETLDDASFIAQILHDLLFVEVDQDLLHQIYIGFGLLVLGSIIFVRPQKRGLLAKPAQEPTSHEDA